MSPKRRPRAHATLIYPNQNIPPVGALEGEVDEWNPETWDEDAYKRRVLNASNRLKGVVPDLHVEELERRNPDFSHWVDASWPATRTHKEPNIKRYNIHEYPLSLAEDAHPWPIQTVDTGGKKVRDWQPTQEVMRAVEGRIENWNVKDAARINPQVNFNQTKLIFIVCAAI